jgi:hypothetical protein
MQDDHCPSCLLFHVPDDDERFIWQATRDMVHELGAEHVQSASPPPQGSVDPDDDTSGALRNVRVLGCPARDEANALALLMLQHLFDPARWEVEIASRTCSCPRRSPSWRRRPRPCLYRRVAI